MGIFSFFFLFSLLALLLCCGFLSFDDFFIRGTFCHCIFVVVCFGGSNDFAVLVSPRESPLIIYFILLGLSFI